MTSRLMLVRYLITASMERLHQGMYQFLCNLKGESLHMGYDYIRAYL
jgi:hypothetical protein